MNKEIKEKMTIGKAKKILRGFLEKDCYYDTPLYYAIPYLLDYITNLQQENERLKEENKYLDELRNANYLSWQDSLSRIEKAVEYIEINCITSDKWEDLGFCNFIPTGKITYKQLNKSKIIELLNILNGKE